MRNDEKFTKGCEKVHSPPLVFLSTTVLLGIYIHYGGSYIFTTVGIYVQHDGYISPINNKHILGI